MPEDYTYLSALVPISPWTTRPDRYIPFNKDTNTIHWAELRALYEHAMQAMHSPAIIEQDLEGLSEDAEKALANLPPPFQTMLLYWLGSTEQANGHEEER
jgi:hypothetical protein